MAWQYKHAEATEHPAGLQRTQNRLEKRANWQKKKKKKSGSMPV